MRILRVVAVAAFAAVLAACATTKQPIGVSAGPQTDERLMGAWKGVDAKSGNVLYVFFIHRPEPDGLQAIAVSAAHGDEKGGWGSYSIVIGKTGAFHFLNARTLFDNGKPGKPDEDYSPALYSIEADGTLHLSVPNVDAFRRAVEAHEIAGEIKGSSVVITAEPAALDAYMAAHATMLFKPAEMPLRRAD